MQQLIRHELGSRVAVIAHSTRSDGDLSPSNLAPDVLAQRRQQLVPLPWCAVRQVHSDRVILSPSPAERPVADALVTDRSGTVLAVHSGDCVPVAFVSSRGAVAAAHAGWKGLEAGVLEATVRSVRCPVNHRSSVEPATEIIAVVGPHIRVESYEFGVEDLNRLGRRFGDCVIGSTADARPALDLTAAIASELDRLEVTVAHWSPDCTARDRDRYWSHRARQESGRIAMLVWLEESHD